MDKKDSSAYRLPVADEMDVTAVLTTKQKPDTAVEQRGQNLQCERHSYDNNQQ